MNEDIQKDIERYLRNELNNEEKILFIQKMENDPLLKEEVSLQESFSIVFGKERGENVTNTFKKEEVEKLKKVIKSEEYRKIAENIKENTSQYLEKRNSIDKKKRIYKIAFTLAAILIIFIAIPSLIRPSNASLYTEYENWDDIPSFVEKGTIEEDLVQIEKNYKSKNYDTVINLINSLPKATLEKYQNLYIYLGSSYFQKGNDKKALKIFNTFSQSQAYDQSKGYWYALLIYLKQDRMIDAKKTLQIIINDPNNYKFQDAKKLLNKIE